MGATTSAPADRTGKAAKTTGYVVLQIVPVDETLDFDALRKLIALNGGEIYIMRGHFSAPDDRQAVAAAEEHYRNTEHPLLHETRLVAVAEQRHWNPREVVVAHNVSYKVV